MFLTTTSDLTDIMEQGIKDGMETGVQILWNAVKEFAAENPLLAGVIVALVLFNFLYPIFKRKK